MFRGLLNRLRDARAETASVSTQLTRQWLIPTLVGVFAGLVLLLVVLLLRSPRDTVVLEIVQESDPNVLEVWVDGAVVSPGLYELERGSRVADAVAAAGGALESGDTSRLGMAALLEDADQIIVPERATAVTRSEDPAGDATPTPGPVNINMASQEDLEALPEIGPVLAGRIIEYRMLNGPFQSVEELVNVSGISERIVDVLGALITIGS